MKYTNRSLWFAVLACLAMGFFARSPQFSGGEYWITIALLLATFILSGIGFWWGLRGAREQRTFWAWLGPVLNALVFLSLLAFLWLLLRVAQAWGTR